MQWAAALGGPVNTLSGITATPAAAPAIQVTFAWTSAFAGNSGVEVWTNAETYAGRHSWFNGAINSTNHSVVLDETDGLVAGSTYNYQVVTSGSTSAVGTFTVPSVVTAVSFDAVASGVAGANTISWTHTCTGASALCVVAHVSDVIGATATYNGVSMGAPVYSYTVGTSEFDVWVLGSPAAGAHSVAVTSSGGYIAASSLSVAGGNAATPLRASAHVEASTFPSSASVASAVGDLVLGAFVMPNTSYDTITGVAGQTLRSDNINGGFLLSLATKAGAAGTVSMGWSNTYTTNAYSQIMLSFKP